MSKVVRRVLLVLSIGFTLAAVWSYLLMSDVCEGCGRWWPITAVCLCAAFVTAFVATRLPR